MRAGIAQVAERRFCKPQVEASITSAGSNMQQQSGDGSQTARRLIVDQVLEGSTPSLPSNFMWACSSVGRAPHLQCGGRDFDILQVHQSFGFVAQKVERRVEGASVAVSKSAEATKMSARSLVWLEALALGAR